MHLPSLPRYVALGVLSTLLAVNGHPHASSSTPALASGLVPRATVCNGHSELCDRTFGNVTFVGAHDSYAIGVNNGMPMHSYLIQSCSRSHYPLVATNQDQPSESPFL